jgi:hypothetical protein
LRGTALVEVDFVELFDACRPSSILSQNKDTQKKYFVYTQFGYAGVLYWKDILLWLVDQNAGR